MAIVAANGQRTIRCYHCGGDIAVGARQRSAMCPKCYRGLELGDCLVRGTMSAARIQTGGRVIVPKKSRLVCGGVVAGAGVEVQGEIHANVVSGGAVVIAPGARWRGDCRAPAIIVAPGAVIEGGAFEIRGPGSGGGAEGL